VRELDRLREHVGAGERGGIRALEHRLVHRHRGLELHQLLLGLRADEVLHERPGRIGVLGRLRDHDARRIDARRVARGTRRQRRDAQVDARREMRRHQPRAVRLHGGLALLEGVADLDEQLRGWHHLVGVDQVLQLLQAADRLGGAEQGLGPIVGDDLAAVLPHQRRPVVLHVRGLGVEAPLLGLAVAVRVERQLLAVLDEGVPGPGLVRIGQTGRVEHRLVVVQRHHVEVARQAVLPVGRREVRHAGIGQRGEVEAVPLDVRGEVEQHAARLVVGEDRAVHREHVGRVTARETGLELVPVGVPVGHRDLDLDVRVFGHEGVDERDLVGQLGRITPDGVLDLAGRLLGEARRRGTSHKHGRDAARAQERPDPPGVVPSIHPVLLGALTSGRPDVLARWCHRRQAGHPGPTVGTRPAGNQARSHPGSHSASAAISSSVMRHTSSSVRRACTCGSCITAW
jgi:hypothetical protein